MPQESFARVAKRRLLGLLLVALVAAGVTLSILIYNKAFTPRVIVTLEANHTGNQLQLDSDVKERGVIVGSVKAVRANGSNAIVTLALEPDRVRQIPNNVKAIILPKTLFGEQYVDLELPQSSNGVTNHPIQAGDVIPQDRTTGALEAQDVIAELYPVLTAVQPAELNSTLTSIATALNGRGKELGNTLVQLGQYLQKMNPHTSKAVTDLYQLGKVAQEYNGVSPDLFASLKNLETNVRTVVQRREALSNLLTTGAGSSDALRTFLADNRSNLITVTSQSTKIFGLLAEYSPEFPCLAYGVNYLANHVNSNVAYNHRLNLSVTADSNGSKTPQTNPPSSAGPYVDGEQPTLVTGYGPNCFGLPGTPTPQVNGNFQIPSKFQCLNDGAPFTDDSCAQRKTSSKTSSTRQTALVSGAGSDEETALVNTLVAVDLGTQPNKVPAGDTLLAAPLMRGHQVVIK